MNTPAPTVAVTTPAPTPAAPTSTAPTLTVADSTLHVSGGGGRVDLGIKESAPSSASSASVTISGLPRYETITDGLGDRFHGRSITLTEAQVNSGLTLTSYYHGTGTPTATLSLTASDTVGGVTSTSAAKTITVIDPPAATSTSTTSKVALLHQYMASGFDHHWDCAPLMSNVAAAFAHGDSFLTSPHHA